MSDRVPPDRVPPDRVLPNRVLPNRVPPNRVPPNRVLSSGNESILASWGIPPVDVLVKELELALGSHQIGTRVLEAICTGVFVLDENESFALHGVEPTIEQAALIACLARKCNSELSLEFGFGMGVTASIILVARSAGTKSFEHLAYDPYGVKGDSGAPIQNWLEREFGSVFKVRRQRSQVGAAKLIESQPPRTSGFILIDGDHHFDGVFADFYAADKLVSKDGFIFFDDAGAPAVETVVNFVRANRPDYEIADMEIDRTAVLRKIGKDERPWDHFVPFDVPSRIGWDLR